MNLSQKQRNMLMGAMIATTIIAVASRQRPELLGPVLPSEQESPWWKFWG